MCIQQLVAVADEATDEMGNALYKEAAYAEVAIQAARAVRICRLILLKPEPCVSRVPAAQKLLANT